jgi:hypothetical protein
MILAALLAVAVVTTATPAFAILEKELEVRYCAGMNTQFGNPDGTLTDCISATHAIEVDFSARWHNAIGQALHYALWTKEIAENPETYARWWYQVRTPRRPGIIFACSADYRQETCANHIIRPLRIAEEYGIPLTIWWCNPDTDMTLEECQRLEANAP